MNAVFLIACAVLTAVPLYFVWHKVYEDGLFGRVSLLGISFSAFTFVIEWAEADGFDVLPQTVMFFTFVAVFLVWHLLRFHRRVVLKGSVR